LNKGIANGIEHSKVLLLFGFHGKESSQSKFRVILGLKINSYNKIIL